MAGGDRLRIEGGAAGAEAHDADVAGDQAHEGEHQHGGAEQGGDDKQDALGDVAVHVVLTSPLAAEPLPLAGEIAERSDAGEDDRVGIFDFYVPARSPSPSTLRVIDLSRKRERFKSAVTPSPSCPARYSTN